MSKVCQDAPTGMKVTVRVPLAGEFVVGSACFVCANGVEWPVDVDFEAFRCERGCHLFSPFHEDDGVVAGVFEFFVESEGFEFIE